MCRGLKMKPNAETPGNDVKISKEEITKKSPAWVEENKGAMISLQKHTLSIFARKYQYGSGIPRGRFSNIKNSKEEI